MTKRTPELESAILKGFAGGRRLLDLCREHGISPSTFQHWKSRDEDLARRYAQAQAGHAEMLIDEGLGIADDPTSSWVQRRIVDADPGYNDHIRHARLRMDARFKAARLHLQRHDAAAERHRKEEAAERQRQDDALPTIEETLDAAYARITACDPPQEAPNAPASSLAPQHDPEPRSQAQPAAIASPDPAPRPSPPQEPPS